MIVSCFFAFFSVGKHSCWQFCFTHFVHWETIIIVLNKLNTLYDFILVWLYIISNDGKEESQLDATITFVH